MSDVENELRSRIDTFVEELSALIRRQALEAVEEVLNKGDGLGTGRRPVKLGSVGRLSGQAPKLFSAGKRRPGEKRSPEHLIQITDQVYGYIKSNSGQGIEQIAKALGTTTKELTLPVRKLLVEKKIGAKGQKRATRYFPR
jgi:hypothetical protein